MVALPDLAALEAAVLHAIVDKNRPALMELLDEDLVITTAGWLIEPARREDWVREVFDRHLLHDFSIDSVDQRSWEDTAVALVLSSQTVTWEGRRQTFRFRYTDVWRAHAGQWRLAVRHASIVPAGGE